MNESKTAPTPELVVTADRITATTENGLVVDLDFKGIDLNVALYAAELMAEARNNAAILGQTVFYGVTPAIANIYAINYNFQIHWPKEWHTWDLTAALLHMQELRDE